MTVTAATLTVAQQTANAPCCQRRGWKCNVPFVCTHIVFSEFVDGHLGLHQVVVEDDDLSAEGSLLLFMVLRLQ